MGITNRLVGTENTSLGQPVAAFDTVVDPEDTEKDIDQFAAIHAGEARGVIANYRSLSTRSRTS